MKIKKKKRKKKNHRSQVCSQRDFSQSSFLRQCRKTLLITASYQLFSVCVSPTTAPLPPAKPVYDETLLSTVSNQVSQFFASPAFAAAPPVGPSGCVALTGGPGPAAGISGMPAAVGGMMLMNSIMQVAIQGLMQGAKNSQLQARHKAQAAQIQQWLAAEQVRIAKLVAQQRSLRDAEVKAGQDELAKALSDRWDAGKGPTGVGSALSDPEVVDLRPQGTPFFGTGGDSSVVDLRDRTRDIPEIPDGNKPPLNQKAFKPTPPSESARKLQRMMKDNHNPARLDANLKKLEDQLARIKGLSEKINTGMNYSPQDLQALNRALTPVIQEGLLRGISLVMGLGPEDLITFYKEMKTNPARMNKLLDAMNTVNQVADFANHYDKFKPGELKDGMWNEANRNIMRDLDFFRTQNAVNSKQFQTGKNMVKESMDLAQSREELGKIEVRVKIKGLSPFFWDRKKQLDQQVQKLADTTRGARRELGLKKPDGTAEDSALARHSEPEWSSSKSARLRDDQKLHAKLAPEKPALTKSSRPLNDQGSTGVLGGEPPSPDVKKEVERLIKTDLVRRQETIDKVTHALNDYRAQTPPVQEYKTILLMGTGNSQEDADTYMRKHFRNPITGEVYDQIYAFGRHGIGNDLVRAITDHLQAERDFLSSRTLEKCARLKNAHIDHLVAHSNAATIAEVLLKRNDIKVRELTLLGGDHTLTNLEGLEKLAKDKGIERINVFVNQGDIVPLLPRPQQLTGFGPTSIMDALFKRISPSPSVGSRVKVVVFDKGPYVYGSSSGIDFIYHYVDNYHNNVRIYQKSLK
jgi:hypothetical protein